MLCAGVFGDRQPNPFLKIIQFLRRIKPFEAEVISFCAARSNLDIQAFFRYYESLFERNPGLEVAFAV